MINKIQNSICVCLVIFFACFLINNIEIKIKHKHDHFIDYNENRVRIDHKVEVKGNILNPLYIENR